MFTHKIKKSFVIISLSRHFFQSKMNLAMQQRNSKIKLYYDDISPPVRSVLILINELNLTEKVDLIFTDLFKGEHLTNEYLKISPMHTVPALVHDDIKLTDSQAILIYMSNYGNNNTLLALPQNNIKLQMDIVNKLFFNGTILFDRDRAIFADIFGNNFDDKIMTKHLEKLREMYNVMESFLRESAYMAGDEITIADISILATVSTLAMLLPVSEDKWPKLFLWFNQMKLRKSYECNLIGLCRLYDILLRHVDFKLYAP